MSFDTALVSRKAMYAHPSGQLILPAWMGSRSHASGIKSPIGRMQGGTMPATLMGHFRPIYKSIDASDGTTFDLLLKESIGATVYTWQRFIDVDIRTQCTGRIDNPLNWIMIKRIIGCWTEAINTDTEASASPRDAGEVIATVSMRSLSFPVIITQVTAKLLPLYLMDIFNSDNSLLPAICAVGGSVSNYAFSSNIVPHSNLGLAFTDDLLSFDLTQDELLSTVTAVSAYQNFAVFITVDNSIYATLDKIGTYPLTGIIDTPTVVHVLDASTVIIGDASGQLYKSTDNGHEVVEVDPYNAMVTDPVLAICSGGGKIFAVNAGLSLAMSMDNGDTFERFPTITGIDTLHDMHYQDGLLYVSGLANTNAVVLASSDLLSWEIVFNKPLNAVDLAGVVITSVKLAASGNGVLYMSFTYVSADSDVISVIYRSVNWGMPNTWELIWSQSTAVAYNIDLPVLYDIASVGVNNAVAVGGMATLHVGGSEEFPVDVLDTIGNVFAVQVQGVNYQGTPNFS